MKERDHRGAVVIRQLVSTLVSRATHQQDRQVWSYLHRRFERLAAHLRERPARGWLLQVLPLTVFFSLVVSTGPSLQNHLFATVNSDAPSVYDAAYSNAIMQWGTLLDWISYGFNVPYLLLGLIVAHLSLRGTKFIDVVAICSLATAGSLIVLDLFYLTLAHEFSISSMGLNVAGNLFGAPIIGLVLGFLLPIYVIARRLFPWLGRAADYLSAGLVVMAGLAISSTIFLALKYLYEPVPVRFDVVFTPPVQGTVIPAGPTDGGGTKQAFDFLPDVEGGGSATLTSPGGLPKVAWAALSENIRYDLMLRLFSNCYPADFSKLPGELGALLKTDVRRLTAGFDKGHSLFQVTSAGGAEYHFEQKYPRDFWIKQQDDGKVGVSYFVSKSGTFSAQSSDQFSLLLGVLMMHRKADGGVVMGDRVLTLNIDGEKIRVPLQHIDSGGRGKCSPVPTPRADRGAVGPRVFQTPVAVPSAQVSAILTLKPRRRSHKEYPLKGSKITIRQANGWLTVKDLDIRALEEADVGAARFVVFKGVPERLEIDGRDIPGSKFDSYVALGDISGDVINGSLVRFTGKASSFWRGDNRLNPTRWERLPMEFRFTLLGALLVFAWGALRMHWWPTMHRLEDDDVREWVA